MLTPAPYKVPETTQTATGTRKSSPRQVLSDSSSDNSVTHSSPEDEEEDEDAPPSVRGGKKRKAAPTGGAEGSKKGRTLLPDYTSDDEYGGEEWPSRVKPLAKS